MCLCFEALIKRNMPIEGVSIFTFKIHKYVLWNVHPINNQCMGKNPSSIIENSLTSRIDWRKKILS
jgi:hypothetical protein